MKKHTLFVLLLLWGLILQAQVLSDFEGGDVDGWLSEGDGSYYWENGFGNPGACFRVDDDATGDMNYAYAPLKFLGDWSPATDFDTLSADFFDHQINGSQIQPGYVYRIAGPGGEAKAILSYTLPLETWHKIKVSLNPADWTMISGTWSTLLQKVNELSVTMEYINGDEYCRLDNVRLTFSPLVTFVTPTLCSDFEEGGFDGWTFPNSGGVTNVSSGGNPGRYIQISDGSNITYAVAPPKFLGNWSLLDNHAAEVYVDFKITSYSGTLLVPDFFIKISGPGGEAKIPGSDIITNAYNKWYTLAFPVESSSWTLVSGDWNALLANVTDVRLTAEFINGSETIGMDNFCISDQPPVADFTADRVLAFVGQPVQFTDLSGHVINSWLWDFGDSQTSTLQHPSHAYSQSGVYDVGLTVSNHYGSSTAVKPAYIEILPIDQCLKFEDNFDDGAIHPLWQTINGTWSEVSGNIRQTSNYYGSNLLGACYALVGSPLWSDYVVSCDFMSTDNDYIGFVFNYQDAQNMYMFYWNAESSFRRLVRWDAGVQTILAQDAVAYTTGTWYHAEITSSQGNIIVKIDNAEIFNVNDNTYNDGKVALYCYGNQSSYWDNFEVSCTGFETDLKVFLQGPFSGTEMGPYLNVWGLLPLVQPYNTAPWNYSGLESVSAIPSLDVVDWILVELRDAETASQATPATQIARQAVLLMKNGNVRATDGINLPVFSTDVNHNLFAVIWHRNHLSVMSGNPLLLTGNTYSYDFSTAASQAYGGSNGHKQIAPGIWGMIGADGDSNGQINNADKQEVWSQQAGSSGYKAGDFNMDGQVDHEDKVDIWVPNSGSGSQVPN
jgi:PKD repeat protein